MKPNRASTSPTSRVLFGLSGAFGFGGSEKS